MNWIEKQKKLEERVYETIDEIAEEFGLEIPYYPESYFVNGHTYFEEFCLPEKYREQFEEMKKRKTGECWADPPIIWINNSEKDIPEECSHSLNFILGGQKKYSSKGDVFFVDCLAETLGFLGSKIVSPTRKNPFRLEGDLYSLPPEKMIEFIGEYYEAAVHQQGYSLGEIMFYEYNKGVLGKEEIARLFKTNFDEVGLAMRTFDKLRKRFWPMPKEIKL